MKYPIPLLALFLLSVAGFARKPPRLLGEARVTGGTERPPVEYACTVYDDLTHKRLWRGGHAERQESARTSYDAQVPEAAAARALAETASGGTISEREGTAGAPSHTYYASVDGASATVFLGSHGPRILENTEPAAKALREFVIRNCRWSRR